MIFRHIHISSIFYREFDKRPFMMPFDMRYRLYKFDFPIFGILRYFFVTLQRIEP